MAVGEDIISVFNGAADKDAYNQVALVPKERTIKVPSDENAGSWRIFTSRSATFASARRVTSDSAKFGKPSRPSMPDDWLLSMEIFEILDEPASRRN